METPVVDFDARDEDGWTRLHSVCGRAHPEVFSRLVLTYGVDFNTENQNGLPPLDFDRSNNVSERPIGGVNSFVG